MSLPINPYSISLVSVTLSGVQGNGLSRTLDFGHYLMSGDGRYVMFWTFADNLAGEGNDLNGLPDVYVKDMLTGDLTLLSGSSGHTLDQSSIAGSLTANAQFATFYGPPTNVLGI